MPAEKLDIGSVGEEVARLHGQLEARGFPVSPEEAKRKFFGPATREAVRECQTCHGLQSSGELDLPTAQLLDSSTLRDAPSPSAAGAPAIAPESVAPITQATIVRTGSASTPADLGTRNLAVQERSPGGPASLDDALRTTPEKERPGDGHRGAG